MAESTVNVAIEGCCHGDLDRIYEVLESIETSDSVKADFMICCGDFQAIRTHEELETLACPPVYRHMKDFHKYWKGERIPRCLTLFVGGNHEAPGHLREMYFGGFASKDIFYFGTSGVFNINGLRVVGLSGIYKSHDFDKPIFEAPPYTEDTKRSAYHVRRHDIEKLKLISQPVDIVVSHDWPTGITDYGDTESMLRLKDRTGQMRREIQSGQMGNPHTMELLKILKPKFWFAGHMHIKYTAIYRHDDGVSIKRFLALDKCIPRRPFLQLVGIDNNNGNVCQVRKTISGEISTVKLDPEWMTILSVNNEAIPIGNSTQPLRKPTRDEIEHVTDLIRASTCNTMEFPYFGQIYPGDNRYRVWICEMLGISDRIGENERIEFPSQPPPTEAAPTGDDDALFFFD
jgi:lariat debranching enzyme